MSDILSGMTHEKLVRVIRSHGVLRKKEGEPPFVLASGKTSRFYVDFDRVMMAPTGAREVTQALMEVLQLFGTAEFDAVGGPSSGADPIVGALMATWPHLMGHLGFKVRKEKKGRGPDPDSLVEGFLYAGDRAVLIEDVTTTGASLRTAIDVVEEAGATVVLAVSLLDRLSGAAEMLEEYEFVALTTVKDLGLEGL